MSLVEIISPSLKTKNFTQANELVLMLSVGHASMKAMLCVYDGLINLYVSRAVRYFFKMSILYVSANYLQIAAVNSVGYLFWVVVKAVVSSSDSATLSYRYGVKYDPCCISFFGFM